MEAFKNFSIKINQMRQKISEYYYSMLNTSIKQYLISDILYLLLIARNTELFPINN